MKQKMQSVVTEQMISSIPKIMKVDAASIYHVYFLIRKGIVVYVGQTSGLKNRIASHRKDKDFDDVLLIPVAKKDMTDLETALIKLLQPLYNGTSKSSNLSERDHAILQAYDAHHLVEDVREQDMTPCSPEDYGEVVVIAGKHAGQIGYYDNDDSDVHEICVVCDQLLDEGLDPIDECPDCKIEDVAIVYLGSLHEGYTCLPHSSIRPLKDSERHQRKVVAEKFFSSFKHNKKLLAEMCLDISPPEGA